MTDDQRKILTKRFADTPTTVLASEMGVSYRTVCRWAAGLGLAKSKGFAASMSATAGKKHSSIYGSCWQLRKKPVFTDGKKTYLQERFAATPNAVLAAELGVNERTIRRWASELRLTKDPKAMEPYCRRRTGRKTPA